MMSRTAALAAGVLLLMSCGPKPVVDQRRYALVQQAAEALADVLDPPVRLAEVSRATRKMERELSVAYDETVHSKAGDEERQLLVAYLDAVTCGDDLVAIMDWRDQFLAASGGALPAAGLIVAGLEGRLQRHKIPTYLGYGPNMIDRVEKFQPEEAITILVVEGQAAVRKTRELYSLER